MLQCGHSSTLSAFAALHGRGIAAAVDEQDRLLPALKPGLHGVDKLPRKRRGPALADGLDPHVDHGERGQAPRVDPAGQPQEPVPAGDGVGMALEGGRRGSEQALRPAQSRAHHRHVPPVVARALVLFVGGFVLLVHDDEPQVPHGREDGRAGAHDDADLARGERQPAVEPLPLPEVAVPDNAPVAGGDRLQPRPQPGDGLRRQGHLGHQHDDAAPGLEGSLDGAQVHLRLAGARDPVQEGDPELPRRERARERGHGRGLLRVEVVRLGGDKLALRVLVGIGLPLDPGDVFAHESPLDEGAHRGGGCRRAREDELLRLRPQLAGE